MKILDQKQFEHLTQVAGLLRTDLAPVERLPLRVCTVLDSVVLHQVGLLERRLPRYQEAVVHLRHREVARRARLRTCTCQNNVNIKNNINEK